MEDAGGETALRLRAVCGAQREGEALGVQGAGKLAEFILRDT